MLLVEETGVSRGNHQPMVTDMLSSETSNEGEFPMTDLEMREILLSKTCLLRKFCTQMREL